MGLDAQTAGLVTEIADEDLDAAITEGIELTRGLGHMPTPWDTARVLIAAPLSWDYVPAPFLDALLGLKKPVIWDWFRVRNSASIATMRNVIAQHFLDTTFEIQAGLERVTTKFTHLFMVDADMVYPRNTLQHLLMLDKDIVSGFASMRDPIPTAQTNSMPEFRHTCGSSRGDNDFTFDYHQQFPVEDVARWGVVSTGGVLIKRRVIQNMAKPWFDNVLWTKTQDGKTCRIGEDVYFYSKAKALGFEIWCDTSIRYGHLMMAMTVPSIDLDTRKYESVVTLP